MSLKTTYLQFKTFPYEYPNTLIGWISLFFDTLLKWTFKHCLAHDDELKKKSVSKLRRYFYKSGGRVMRLADLEENQKVLVNVCELEGAHLFFGIEYERFERDLLKLLVKPGAIFFDVGSNIGIYCLLAARLVGRNSIVHAFEPSTTAYENLLTNLNINGMTNVIINNIALSDKTGEIDLFINRESGLTSLGNTGRGQVIKIEKVQCLTLDDYASQNNVNSIDILKVDVEGYEGHVLRGAEQLIMSSDNLLIMCELAEKNYQPLGVSINEVLDWMRDRDYLVWEIDGYRKRISKLIENQKRYEHQNFIFARKGSQHQAVIESNS